MNQIRIFSRYLGSLLLQICAAILAGTLLLTLICMMPSRPMDRNLEESAATFAEEGIYPELFPWCTSQLDSTTDALILLISACDSQEPPLIQAMSGTRNTEISDTDDLVAHYGEGIPFDDTEPYYQYWHGYQLIIRPVLSLMNYPSIRILNGIVQTCLLVVLCCLLYKRNLGWCIIPYLLTVAMLMPIALAKSLQFSSCYYILTIGSIALLHRRFDRNRFDGILFLWIGIATAYFDFLTYPAATLGIPAVFYFCLRDNTSVRDTFCRGVKICFSWGLGYVGMWSGKWLIGSLILKKNILTVAAGALMERSSAAESANFLKNARTALSANLRSFLHTPATIVVIAVGFFLLLLLIRRCRRGDLRLPEAAAALFPFVILAVIPPVWYIVTSNHSIIHHWFTNKALCVSVLAVLAGMAKISKAHP